MIKRLVGLSIVLGPLTGCGLFNDTGSPNLCPALRILAEARDQSRFRQVETPDAGDLAFEAQVLSVNGLCNIEERILDATVSIEFEIMRGPALPERKAEIRYFISQVKTGEQIAYYDAFRQTALFQPNQRRIRFIESVNYSFTMPAGTTLRDYQIIVGFRLTPAELDYNRRRKPL